MKGFDDMADFWAELLGRYPAIIGLIDPMRKQVIKYMCILYGWFCPSNNHNTCVQTLSSADITIYKVKKRLREGHSDHELKYVYTINLL